MIDGRDGVEFGDDQWLDRVLMGWGPVEVEGWTWIDVYDLVGRSEASWRGVPVQLINSLLDEMSVFSQWFVIVQWCFFVVPLLCLAGFGMIYSL